MSLVLFRPPFLIFVKINMQPRLLDGAPSGTPGTCIPNVRPTREKKTRLLSLTPFTVIANTSNMNIRTEGTNSLERIDIPESVSTHALSLIQ